MSFQDRKKSWRQTATASGDGQTDISIASRHACLSGHFATMTMTDLPLQLLDGAQSLYKQYVAPYVSPTSVAVLMVAIAISHAYLRSRPPTAEGGTEKSSSSSSASNGRSKSSKKPKDIFDTFHRGKDKKDGSGKKARGAEKPFGSSYY